MKIYTFPIAFSFGPGDSSDSEIAIPLEDEEARRLEASAKAEPRWRLSEDPALEDILRKVTDAAVRRERETTAFLFPDPEERRRQDDLIESTPLHVNYPEELQFIEE